MQERRSLTRREFTVASALAMLSGVTITVSSCGGGGSPSTPSGPNPNPTPTPTPTPTPDPGASDKVGSISANHGHSAVITAAELTAGAAVTVQLTTGQGHTHSVSLTAADVMQIAGGTRVSRQSTNDAGHTHTVTFN